MSSVSYFHMVKQSSFSVILVMLALALLGFGMIPYLQINFLPTADFKNIRINYSYPRADPEQVERVITTPLEAQLSLIEGIDKLKSVSRHQGGYIVADIAKGTDIAFLRYEIATKIRELYPRFPVEIPFPTVTLNDANQKAIDPVIISYSLLAPRSQEQIYDYCRDRLIPSLSAIPFLERIELVGRQESQWVIRFDTHKCAAYGVSPDMIAELIQLELRSETFAYHRLGEESLYVRSTPDRLDNIKQRLIKSTAGEVLPIASLIDIRLEEGDPTRYYRINGKNSIRLNFIPHGSANQLELAENIHKRINEVRESLPAGYDLHLDYDTTDYIRDELGKIRDRTWWSLGLLALFVIMIYRSLRDLFIIFVSLIVNIGLALIAYRLFAIQINLYALAAITISFGIIIDNSIVVSHHYQRRGNLAVYPAIVSSTLTTLSSLVIVFLLPDQLKLSLIDFAKVLGINLALSLVVCYAVVPALITQLGHVRTAEQSHFFKRKSLLRRINKSYLSILTWMRPRRPIFIVGVLLLFGFPVFYLPNSFKNQDWYNKSFGTDYYIENIKPWVNRALGGTLRLFSLYVYEGSSYRTAEQTKLNVNAALPLGSTIEQMNDVMIRIESYLQQYDTELESYITQITSGQYAQISITFNKKTPSSFPYLLKSRLEGFAIDLGGVTWRIYGVGKGFSNASGNSIPSFNVLLKGYNKDRMALLAEEFATLLLVHPRVQEVNKNANLNYYEKDLYQWEVKRNNLVSGDENLTTQTLYALLDDFNQRRFRIGQNQDNLAIVMKPHQLTKQDKWGLLNKTLYRDSSQYLLNRTILMNKSKVSQSIHKEDQSYIQKIEFEYTGSGRFGQKYLDECMTAFIPTLPLGYSLQQTTWSFFASKAKTQYSLVILIIILIFVICTIHFESLIMGALVVILIPLSYIGIFGTFYYFDFPFDQGGYTSFILVSGLAVNSIILLLSDYNRLVGSFPHLRGVRAYARAFRHKSSPIYLSIASTAVGLIPFTLHGRDEVFWFSLAVGTIGGLVFSILVLLFVVPLFLNSAK